MILTKVGGPASGTNLDSCSPGEVRVALAAAIAGGLGHPATALNLALAEEKCGEPDAARARIERLMAAYPHWDEPPLRLAENRRRAGDWGLAEEAYRRVLSINSCRLEALVALGAELIARGRAGEAVPLLVKACGLPSPGFEAWHALALALAATNDPSSAEAAFAVVARMAPDNLDIALQRAEAAFHAGTADAELARLDALSCRAPLSPLPHRARAHLFLLQCRFGDCIDALQVAAALAPDDASYADALGSALAMVDRSREAEAEFRRGLALDPAAERMRHNLAAVLIRLLKFCEAETLLRALIAEQGESPSLLGNLATALIGQGRQDDAVAVSRRAIETIPDGNEGWRSLASVLPYSASAEDQAEALRACAARFPRGASPRFSNPPLPDRTIRVGLVSNCLRKHPVSFLTIAAWEALDRSRFDLVCFGRETALDPMSRRFAALASAWHDVTGLDDEAAAALCREAGIDILVDLNGYGESGRPGIAASRAAPVQIKWVGSQFGTTGLAEMDWMITDRWETPPECAGLYTERLLHMPDGYVCYDPPSYAPDVTPLPALSTGWITFGCLNNLAKITPDVIATWARVLVGIPNARLLVKAPQFGEALLRAAVRDRFCAAGLDERRLILRGASNHPHHLATYREIDIALDPFPYSGGLSTCEALWMGVPTITLPGRSFASRHTLSHQENVGLSGWAAESIDEYVAMAVRRAGDLEALARLRSGLRSQVAASPLCDAPRFGHALGAVLARAWQTWCDAQPVMPAVP